MRRIGILMACGALALAFGCDERDPGIMLMDSGPEMEDAGPPDSGQPDSGPPAPMCSVAGASGFPPLPAGCLPRCAPATTSCVMGCTTGECQNMCVQNDTTAAIQLEVSAGITQPLNCSACWNWQINSCVFDSCPAELGACTMCADGCNPMTAGCETEETALDSCLMTNMSAVQACANSRLAGCLDTSSGFLPTFGPRVQVDPSVFERLDLSLLPTDLGL